MIKRGNQGDDAPDFSSGKNDGELVLWIGARQFDFMGPNAFKRFLPKHFDGANDLGAGLAGELLFGLEVNAILADLLGRDQIGRFIVELAQLTDTGVVSLLGAGKNRQEFQIIRKGI